MIFIALTILVGALFWANEQRKMMIIGKMAEKAIEEIRNDRILHALDMVFFIDTPAHPPSKKELVKQD